MPPPTVRAPSLAYAPDVGPATAEATAQADGAGEEAAGLGRVDHTPTNQSAFAAFVAAERAQQAARESLRLVAAGPQKTSFTS